MHVEILLVCMHVVNQSYKAHTHIRTYVWQGIGVTIRPEWLTEHKALQHTEGHWYSDFKIN